MNVLIKDKEIHFPLKTENNRNISEKRYRYDYIFDFKYEIISPIIKDIQKVSQLISFVKNHQLSDLIFICGNNSYSLDSRFYFNYRNMIDFYLRVIDFMETDCYTKIKYNIYKTKPISKNFIVNISLIKNIENENISKLEIEVLLYGQNITISQRILNIIYKEFDCNFQYLSEAIKNQKINSCFYKCSIIKNEFDVLAQILQNVKLIEYLINGKLEKVSDNNEIEKNDKNCNFIISNNDKFIHLNDIYKVVLNKKKEIKDWLSSNRISLKIQFLNTREDKMVIQFKILSNNSEMSVNQEYSLNNIIIVHLRKLSLNSCFVLIKSSWNFDVPQIIFIEFKQLLTKCLTKIVKLCEIAKDKNNL